MWNFIYDRLVQLFAGLKWSIFLYQNNSDINKATQLRNLFRNDLYTISGMVMIAITALVAVLYYFVLNRRGGSGYAFKTRFWLTALSVNSFVVAIVMLSVSISMTRGYSLLHPFKYCLSLGFVNLVYSAILFVALSLVFKRYSVARTTPF
ncbi:hypothetical protein ACFOWA_01860 [Pedobacter lithocola]|uniref:PGG domain-containing protein n=1 Tax=Pedobacter lithocola TaxID=1908239 RepID=A0ABV8P6M0_9SPHI